MITSVRDSREQKDKDGRGGTPTAGASSLHGNIFPWTQFILFTTTVPFILDGLAEIQITHSVIPMNIYRWERGYHVGFKPCFCMRLFFVGQYQGKALAAKGLKYMTKWTEEMTTARLVRQTALRRRGRRDRKKAFGPAAASSTLVVKRRSK